VFFEPALGFMASAGFFVFGRRVDDSPAAYCVSEFSLLRKNRRQGAAF
jgi:hypothetical protein